MDERYVARFWQRVDKSGPAHPYKPELGRCWVWTGPLTDQGYGVFFARERPKPLFRLTAHRMVWEIVTGRAPGDWYVLHSCDNPPCCNPAHLRLGTHLENIQDRTDRGRYRRGGIGEAHHSARLTKTTARDAYESVVAGEPVLDVAARYGVTKEAIYKIVYGQSWKELGLTPIKLGRRDSA